MGQACCNAEAPTPQTGKKKHRAIFNNAGAGQESSIVPAPEKQQHKIKRQLNSDDDSDGLPGRDASTHLTDKNGSTPTKQPLVMIEHMDTEQQDHDIIDTQGQQIEEESMESCKLQNLFESIGKYTYSLVQIVHPYRVTEPIHQESRYANDMKMLRDFLDELQ